MPSRKEQGKSEGFESCDRPIDRICPIWVKICDVLFRVTLKFDGWPWKTIGHLSFAVSSFVQHFIAIGEFKLKLQSGNAQSRSISTFFLAVWPWNLMDDLQQGKTWGIWKLRPAYCPETPNLGQNRWCFVPCDLEIWWKTLKTIGHLSFAVSSFVHYFIVTGEFKMELQSGNAQFGSNSTIFRAVWP